MSQPTSRVFALLEILQTYPGLRGAELAERLGVDERTVRRYIAALVELGIPVHAGRGRYGGYRLRPGYKLPPLMFTDAEAVAVILGLLAARRIGMTTLDDDAAAALAKVQRVVPDAVRQRTIALESSLDFTLRMPMANTPDTDVLLAIGQAVTARRTTAIGYRSWRGADSERDIDPYGLVFHSGRWYVSGLDHRSGERRTFRVDRIGTARILTAGFSPPQDFDPAAELVRSLSAVPYRWQVEVLLEAGIEQAKSVIPPTVGELTPTGGGVLLRARAENLDGMARMLAGIGIAFTVRSPVELREAVIALAERLRGFAETDAADRRSLLQVCCNKAGGSSPEHS